jgi:hypothetical protein
VSYIPRSAWEDPPPTNKPQVIVEKVGKIWMVYGQTYQIKEELKKRGARWDGTAWIFSTEPVLNDIAEVIYK